jgi:glycosyltransferase involved in cell wall biosynthesis
MKQKVIVYIITKLELGGAQKICLSLYQNNSVDFDTVLITGTEGKLVEQVQHNHNVIFLPSLKREISCATLLHEIKTVYFLIKQLRAIKKNYKTVIVHTHSTKAGILGRWAAFFARIPHRVHTVHGFSFHAYQSWPVWLLHYVCELLTSFVTTQYVCVSSADITTGTRLFPFFTKRVALIRAAVDTERFIPAQRVQKDTFVFGTVSCFKPQKNLFDLLNAFAQVHTQIPHTRLEILGDGIQRNIIEAWIKEHNLEKIVTLHGWQDDVAPYLQQWDVFTLSSLWEGLPCAIVEARLMKLPVIAYDTGGISDVIRSYENGILVEQKNIVALAEAMSRVAQDSSLFQRMSHASQDLRHFSNKVMIHQHQVMYSEIGK